MVEETDKTWQKSMKSYRCNYDCERKASELEKELDDANIKVLTLAIQAATSQQENTRKDDR
jgi:hypothetical protein